MTEDRKTLMLHIPNVRKTLGNPGPKTFLRLMDRDNGKTLFEFPVEGDIEVTQEIVKDGKATMRHLGTIRPHDVSGREPAADGPDPVAPPAETPKGSAASTDDKRHQPEPAEADEKHGKGGKQK